MSKTWKAWPMNISRTEGCTLTGALSVTTAIPDGISIIHGPDGCAHHNFSLLHSLMFEHGRCLPPDILCSSLSETEIVFGGEERLGQVLSAACRRDPGVISVLTSCVADAIGDDARSVCSEVTGIPVIVIPTGGFLGGGFSHGISGALEALSVLGEPGTPDGSVCLVGEKNLEYEAEANFDEMARLLSLLGARIGLRFVRNTPSRSLSRLGTVSLNVVRDPSLAGIGETFRDRFGTPFIGSFPVGFQGTLDFLEEAGDLLGIDPCRAVRSEQGAQERLIASFSDISGSAFHFEGPLAGNDPVIGEIAEVFDLELSSRGTRIRVPDPLPVGTSGLSRMLHRWRRVCRA